MTAQQLKNSILQMAVQGKLVPQDLTDEPASVLLERIRVEKEELIKTGKTKNEKPLPPITGNEMPFEIPESWEWVRLGEVCSSITDGDHQPPPQVSQGIPFLVISNVSNGYIDWSNTRYVPEEYYDNIQTQRKPEIDDILFTVTGSYGIPLLVNEKRQFCFQRHIALLKPLQVNRTFILQLLQSPCVKMQCDENATGTAQKTVSLGTLRSLMIPLPPLAEQYRIVERIEQLLPHIADYDIVKQKLTALNAIFPEQLKKSILQSAVQGKLIKQDPNDKPVSALLERIRMEKEQLAKEGKIKKEKPLPPITEDEIPFDIPKSWKWVRLGNIGNWGSGATPNKGVPAYFQNGNIPWLLTGDLNDGHIQDIPSKITSLALQETSVRLNPIGSVLIAMYGATIGKVGILDIEATTNQACCACIPIEGVYNEFLFYFLMSQRDAFRSRGEGGAQPNISKEKIVATLFPLPPLAEQQRIVEKIDNLLPIIERCG
jgi:type I restriction enzyme S subunit